MKTMERRRASALMAALLAMLALAGPLAVEARQHRHQRAASRTKRCRNDKQCGSGTCNGAGQCCAAGTTACGTGCCVDGDTCCGTTCTVTSIDSNNCGGCGIVCSGDQRCDNGVCACPSGDVECNGLCTDLSFDDQDCGACGHACDPGLVCIGGQCECADVGQALCNGACIDVASDRNNCGNCGTVCATGEDCVGGTCQAPCDACHERVNGVCVLTDLDKTLVCNGICVDPKTDPNNCGSCGNVCLGADTCQNGVCTGGGCPVQWHSCGVSYPHVSDVCCLNGNQCCIGGRNTSCYGDGTCCVTDLGDAFICATGTHCCPHSVNGPCFSDDDACPAS